MFTSNPFVEISGILSPAFMQAYVIIMVVLVVGGTLYDVIHKKSAKYFFKNWQQQKNSGARQVGGCLLYTSPSPRDLSTSRMPSSA